MTPNDFRFGFRIVGGCYNERRLVDADAAFVAHARCDPKADLESECYLSAFRFGDDFATYLNATGSTKGYTGATWSAWLWFDIDRDELDDATNDARRLAAHLLERFSMVGDELLLFYSGSKGFHIGLPTSLWLACPAIRFHAYCRKFAESIAEAAKLVIDSGVYDRVRAFRAPNSRHQKTGRHKRFLGFDELMSLTTPAIAELAAEPVRFELPKLQQPCRRAMQDWQAAIAAVDIQQANAIERRLPKTECSTNSNYATLNRATVDFMRDGASSGDRHRRLFSAAANLNEFGCGFELAWALLSESALDIGLSPNEVRRQIECGLNHRGGTQ